MSDRFDKIKKQLPSERPENAQPRKSDWLHECQAMGCPLKPSVIRGGHQLCTFHNGESEGEGFSWWNAISAAINQNIHLIKKSYSLINKDTEFWAQHTAQLSGWDFCPMDENEWPSQYTAKLLNKVNKLILKEAKELQTKGIYKSKTPEAKKTKPKGMKSIVELAEEQIKQRKDVNG